MLGSSEVLPKSEGGEARGEHVQLHLTWMELNPLIPELPILLLQRKAMLEEGHLLALHVVQVACGSTHPPVEPFRARYGLQRLLCARYHGLVDLVDPRLQELELVILLREREDDVPVELRLGVALGLIRGRLQ